MTKKNFTPESELSQHLIAELFAKTAQMVREADARELPDIILSHDNQLVAIANATALVLGRNKATKLAYEGRGYAFAQRQPNPHVGYNTLGQPVALGPDGPVAAGSTPGSGSGVSPTESK